MGFHGRTTRHSIDSVNIWVSQDLVLEDKFDVLGTREEEMVSCRARG